MTGRYINLFTDFGFKKIFGEEHNKDLLIHFLNELLRDREKIIDLTYLNTEHLGKGQRDRKAVYDLYCTNDEDEKFIVEVQRVKQQYFKDRSLYYSTFAIQAQARKGKDWNYELRNVYTIGILDFEFDDSPSKKFHHNVKLVETTSNKVFYDKLTFVFLEIPKFDKPLEELENDYERWLFAFKNLHKLADKPNNLQEGVFRRLLEIAEVAKYNKKEQFVYQESLKDYWDLQSVAHTYFTEGDEQRAIKTVLVGIQEGLSNELLMKMTDLSEEKINELRKKKE